MSDLELMERNALELRRSTETLALRVSREHYLALADQIDWLNNAYRIERAFSKEQKGWRCFHCNAVFLDPDDARSHFGHSGDDAPGCLRTDLLRAALEPFAAQASVKGGTPEAEKLKEFIVYVLEHTKSGDGIGVIHEFVTACLNARAALFALQEKAT